MSMIELDEFDLEVTKAFNKNVSEFLKKNFGFILFKEDNKNTNEDRHIIKYFMFKGKNDFIYKRLNNPSMAQDLINDIKIKAENMSANISEIIYVYKDKLNENFVETLEIIHNLIEKFIKTLNNRGKSYKVEDVFEVSEMQENFYQFIQKTLKESFIERIIPPIYEGMKNNNIEIYEIVLIEINEFLSSLGISSLNTKENEKINFDYFYPLTSEDNVTKDYFLKEVIKEVRQVPYIFDEEHVICEGKAVIWRLE